MTHVYRLGTRTIHCLQEKGGGQTMNYEKQVMSKKELMKMGFPEDVLLRASREKNQTFGWRQNPKHRTSQILFDTEGFETWRLPQVGLEHQYGQLTSS